MELERGPKRDDLLDVTIDNITAQGLGEATVEAFVGPQRERKVYTVFVRKTVPGDRVRVRVEQSRRKRITAHVESFLEPSPMRIKARCRHFGFREVPGEGCGGCTMQSLDYRHQLIVKERMVKKIMQAGGVDPGLVYPVLGMEEPWYYRNKMEFSFGDDAERAFALGLHPTGYKYEVLNLEECYLESEFVSEFIPFVRAWFIEQGLEPVHRSGGFLRNLTIREGKRTGERLVELVTSHVSHTVMEDREVEAWEVAERFRDFIAETGEVTSLYWTQYRAVKGEPTRLIEHHMYGEPVYHEELHLPDEQVLRFEVHPRAFFQPNPLQAEVLYATVLERTGLRGASRGELNVLDLYCGTGTIGLCMAPYARKVVGIEMQRDAVANARKNAAHNGIDNVEFFVGDVGKVLGSDEFAAAVDAVDIVVVDPPRAGLLAEAREHLKVIGAPRIVYVSCNPQALARDLIDLQAAGYRTASIQPVDMFPQTHHIENVALLERI